MTGALKPYPAYRDSGLPWLGRVPAHWETQRLKTRVADVVDMTNRREPSEIYIVLEHVESCTGKIVDMDFDTTFESQVKRFQPNDVLFGKLRPYLAKVTRPGRDGVCVGEFLVLRPKNDDLLSNYLEIFLRSKSIVDTIDASTFGAKMPRVDWQFIGNMRFLLPPIPEQAAIARYLDHVGARVDRHIGAKERLIALLKERKQAIIDRAVTRGLDPNAPMKPTGIAWMPEVPAHWEVRRLGQMGRLLKGNGGSKEDETSTGIPCVRYGDLYTTHSYFIEKSRQFISKDTSKNYTPIAFGDVLFAASGETIDEIGKSAVNLMRTAACCGGDVILFRPEDDTVASYMGYALDCRPSAAQKAAMGRGITVMHIYAGQLKRLLVPLPPIPEQAAIAEHLERSTAAIDTAIARARRQIGLLREYRERLINDVVTGKLDVRGVHVDGHDPSEETVAGHRRGSLTGVFAGSDAPGA